MPYRIAFLSKFPPIEGGIAAKTFWLARGLAKRGHEVHVITHGISAGGKYRIQGGENIPQDIPNLWIHRLSEDIPWHIPEDNEQTLSLLDLTIDIIRKYDIQIIDTGYMVPYGIIGNLAKLSTRVRHLLRHGGSDIEKFYKKGIWDNMLLDTIKQADIVITDRNHESLFKSLSQKVIVQPAYIPDEEVFKYTTDRKQQNRLAFIGKINFHWQHKRLDDIAHIMYQLSDQCECLIVGQGNGLLDFQDKISNHIVSKLKWLPFVPPWQMPQLLNQMDAIFIFESELPYPVFSNLAMEAAKSGVGIITDHASFSETFQDIVNLDEDHVILVPETEVLLSSEIISHWLSQRNYGKIRLHQLTSYNDWLSSTEKTYLDIELLEKKL